MTVRFKLADVGDAAIVAQLVDDMDIHYRGAGNTVGVAAAIPMVEAAIRTREGTRFLLALDGREAVGIACFAVLRPGYRQQGLVFLKDLFVHEHLRGRGIGRALMAELARFALAHGIGRIDLTTDADNAKAAALYDSLGGHRQEKIMFRYDGEGLRKLATHDPERSGTPADVERFKVEADGFEKELISGAEPIPRRQSAKVKK